MKIYTPEVRFVGGCPVVEQGLGRDAKPAAGLFPGQRKEPRSQRCTAFMSNAWYMKLGLYS